MKMFSRAALLALASAALMTVAGEPAAAEIAVSANDGKVRLVDGTVETVKDGRDTISFIDLGANPPVVLATLDAPASVVGPPTSVAVSPKEDIALVTAAMKIDPADPTKTIPDDKVTVIDLTPLRPSLTDRLRRLASKGAPPAKAAPKILATLTAGKGAAGVTFNKAGTLVLVANRSEGTVSVFTVSGSTVTPAGKVDLGNPNAGPSGVVFTTDGKTALVTLDGESANKIAVLAIEGTTVTYTKRDLNAGLRPYGIDIAKTGDVAVVANIGRGAGDADTISVIDLKAVPSRVVTTVTVGPTPEGIKLSPDGKYVAVVLQNGTNKPKASPVYRETGLLQVWTRTGTALVKTAELAIGKWCQGAAWNSKSNVLLVQCMVEEEIQVIRFAGRTLQKTGSIKITGGPAGIRTMEP